MFTTVLHLGLIHRPPKTNSLIRSPFHAMPGGVWKDPRRRQLGGSLHRFGVQGPRPWAVGPGCPEMGMVYRFIEFISTKLRHCQELESIHQISHWIPLKPTRSIRFCIPMISLFIGPVCKRISLFCFRRRAGAGLLEDLQTGRKRQRARTRWHPGTLISQ